MSLFDILLKKLRKRYSQIDPIMIIAPTQRCGTTLLQRAINAGGEAIIYGENFLLFEMLPMDLGSAVSQYDEKLRICGSTLEAFKQGKTNIDATALFPDFEGYIEQLLSGYYDNLAYYYDYSQQLGVKKWGIKHQPNDIKAFINSLILLPSAKIIFIYRDLLDVAKSMKARWPAWLDNEQKLIGFGQRWADNIEQITSNNKCHLIIKYEDLIANPAGYIADIQKIIGVKIAHGEFANKVNSHFVDKDIQNTALKDVQKSGNYIKPSGLSDKEKSLLLTNAQEIYDKLGYSI